MHLILRSLFKDRKDIYTGESYIRTHIHTHTHPGAVTNGRMADRGVAGKQTANTILFKSIFCLQAS